MHEVVIRLTSDQAQILGVVLGVLVEMVLIGATRIVQLSHKVRRLERAGADLRRRLLTAETIGDVQALALQTVDALARATRRGKR